MMEQAELKARLRQQLLLRRQQMSVQDWRNDSATVVGTILDLLKTQEAKTVLCHVSSKDNELNTLELIRALLERDCIVAVPRMLPGFALEWRQITGLSELSRVRFGILEPSQEACPLLLDPEHADLCFVPALVWDEKGYRIGYGLGFFDRFLSVFCGTTIGLGFDFQVVPVLPREAHDQPVQCLITEKSVRHFPPRKDCTAAEEAASAG